MRCQRCGNEDPRFFYSDAGIPYCRKCAGFARLDLGQKVESPHLRVPDWKGKVHLDFALTEAQQAASDRALSALGAGKDVFVYAAAGAGKTEMSLASIDWFLRQGKKVCFAISRRQVVLEIADRLRAAFPGLDVVEVCQDHTRKKDGDLIVCTTHQLYRWPGCFDLLILDEMDAYPYVDNEMLQNLADAACSGVKLMLSATPDAKTMRLVEEGRVELVSLFRRPHGKALPVPSLYKAPVPFQILKAIRTIKSFAGKQVLVFVPRRKDVKTVTWLLSPFFSCAGIHSQTNGRDAILDRFRNKEFQVLVTTTLLERGITIGSVQVIVLMADHPVFTTASLIQIFGRAGRKFTDPEGECLCCLKKSAPSVSACVKQLEFMNRSA